MFSVEQANIVSLSVISVIQLIIITNNKNSIYSQMQDQFEICPRDDILVFSDALSKSTHNIKSIQNYRKSHNSILKRNEPTQCTNDHGYVWTIDNSERIIEHQSHEKMKINLNTLPVRRASVTACNSRRKNHQAFKTQARTLNLSNNISTREQPTISFKKAEKNENKFATIQKKYNKGPLKDKYLACWLNSLLLQACQDEKFDASAENPALQKYNLDENSLRSKGIRPENMTRIYKSLFVYSIGFNDLLKEICQSNMNLRKTIWKVFAILLEYCAQGDFEMMIAEIERDKIQKVENLTNQILKRQKIIENNDEINERKNVKIYKQIKQLRDENINLQNQKEALLEQFKQAEQAFNQEVALRLKYENKINQIHGVYTEIQNKHSRLLYDHGEIVKEVEKLRALTANQNKIVTDVKKDNQHKAQQIQLLQKDLKYKFQLIGYMESKKHGDANLNIENSNNIKDLKLIIQQKNRQIMQLNITLNSTNLILETEKLQHQHTSQSLAASLQQNSKLHGTIQQQMRDLNQLLLSKRNFGIKTSEVQAQTVIMANKLNQKTKQVKQLTKKVQELQQESRKLKVQVEIQKKLKLQHEESLKVCHQNIRDMKLSKNLIQEQNDERKRKMETIDQIIEEKDNKIKQYTQKIDAQNEQISSCKQSLKIMESKIDILNEKVRSSEQIYAKKLSILKHEKQTIQRQYIEFGNLKKILELQRDKLREQFEASELNFKNEKFERANLKIYYDNSLNTGKQKNQAIKNLDIQISQLSQELAQSKRKLKSSEFLAFEKENQFKKQKEFWIQRANQLVKQNKQHKFYVHPMVHEDVCENYRIFKNKYDKLKTQNASKIKQLEQFIQTKQSQIKDIVKLRQQKQHEIIKKYEAIVERKQNQLLYEANKCAHLVQTNKELQQNLSKYVGDGKGQLSFEREERYLNDIKQKKQQIDTLLKDLQAIQDANKSLRENYLNFEKAIPQKQKELKQLKNTLTQTKQHFKSILHQKQNELLQKQEQIIALKQLQRTNSNKFDGNIRLSKSKELGRATSGKKNDNSNQKRQVNIENDSKRNDFARKYKGAYIYYAK